ncbi:inositol-pentakisphosphate 2-kinase [Bombardia bombarda]|uniref:Inositol-pentakisphosphate 2-kinase n=1 Tax=Bombardia bombarda TaxID=252184 RepID=A0AA39XB72_9PEZI|nr:inositol-pentakisphosphate 2-kinase [Bombardia bombarda]
MASTIPKLADLLGKDYRFSFVGEGAANLVFEVHPQSAGAEETGTDTKSVLKGHLLRVPKAGTQAYKHEDLQHYWETSVRPLFEEDDLVQQHLVRLTNDIASHLNAALQGDEAGRREDFKGSQVADAEFGMLVEDMRKKNPDDLVLEFKPKWLAQSPNAPPAATRCRNCAREASRKIKATTVANTNTTNNTPPSSSMLCPFDFLECRHDQNALERVLGYLAGSSGSSTSSITQQHQHDRLAQWLRTNELLPRLRTAQLDNDSLGPLDADIDDPKFLLVMTLRDCTCFVRVPATASEPIEAKLADLDKKNGEAKLSYWQATERRLVDKGYYFGTERPYQITDCQLLRQGN